MQASFEELDAFVTPADSLLNLEKLKSTYGDGVIVGHGKVNGRLVFALCSGFHCNGRIAGYMFMQKRSPRYRKWL